MCLMMKLDIKAEFMQPIELKSIYLLYYEHIISTGEEKWPKEAINLHQ